jgi:hypothetical protein
LSDGPPIVVSGPDNITVLEGAPALFDVSVDGYQKLSYQWKSNGVAIAGANGSSYTTPPTTPAAAYDGTHWSVMVSNDCGIVTSKVATLTVCRKSLSIARDPNDPTHKGLVIQWCFPGRLQCTTALMSDPSQTVWQDVNDPITGLPVPSPYLIPNPITGTRFYRLISP